MFCFTQKGGGINKACSIILWQKSTSFFGINPACIFYEIHIQNISGLPKTSRLDEYNIFFPRDKDEKVDVENGIYNMKNQQKKAMFKCEKEWIFCLGVAKVESLDGKMTCKHCRMFDYTGGGDFTINSYKK